MTVPRLSYSLSLTEAGKKRLDRIVQKVEATEKKSLNRGFELIVKKEIINKTPSPSEEAILLSKPGVPAEKRFWKGSEQLWFRDAISMEQSKMTSEKSVTYLSFGDVRGLSMKIGFSWGPTPKAPPLGGDGATGSTEDSKASARWKLLALVWEKGGTFHIQGRIDPKTGQRRGLHISPGVFRKEVNKSIQPRRMFAGTWETKKGDLVTYIEQKIKSVVRSL